jgi:hypothetical protein
MRTRLTIMAIVLAAATGAPDTIALLAVVLGWLGLSAGPIGGGRHLNSAQPRALVSSRGEAVW